MTYKLLKKEIKNRWYLITFIPLLALISSSFYCFNRQKEFSASLIFIVPEIKEEITKENLEVKNSTINTTFLISISKSTELFDFLIKEFDLFKNYNILNTDSFAYEKLYNILNKNIVVTQTPNKEVKITVSGDNNDLCARMANSIFYKLEDMVKIMSINKLRKYISIYSEILNETKNENSERINMLNNVLSELKIINTLKPNTDKELVTLTVYNNLLAILNELTVTSNNLNYEIKTLKKLIVNSEEKNLDKLILVTKATKEFKKDGFKDSLLIIISITLSALISTVGIIIFLTEYKEKIYAFFYE